jgi:hypothetical protein
MQLFVEVWYRPNRKAAYCRHGLEQVAALLEAGMPMALTVAGCEQRVTVDNAERIAAGAPAAGRLWVTRA